MSDPDLGTTEAPPHHGARLARMGLIAAMVSRLFGRVVGILLVVIIAREADSDTVALYGYLLGTATLVATLTDLGVASIAGREVAAGRLPARETLWAALVPQTFSVLAAAAICVLLTVTVGPASVPASALWLTALFVVATGFLGLWGELLRATGRVMFEGALQMVGALLLVVVGIIVVHLGGDVTDLLIVVALKEVALLAVSVAVLPPRRDVSVRSRQLLGQSLWIAVAGTAIILLWRQGTLVVGTGSIGALATYVVASRYLDAGVTIAHTTAFGLVPGMSALANDPAAFRHNARRYLGLATLLGAAVAVVGALAAHPLTVVPFGDRWSDAAPTVAAIAVSSLPIMVAFVTWPMLLARGQVRLVAIGSFAGLFTGLAVTTALFVRSDNPVAAAVGTGAGATVLALIMLSGIRDLFQRAPEHVPGVGVEHLESDPTYEADLR